jgi:hypothetical protein
MIKQNLKDYKFKNTSKKEYDAYLKKLEKRSEFEELVEEHIGDLTVLEPMLKYGIAEKHIDKSTTLDELFRMTYKTYMKKKGSAKFRKIHMPMTYKEYVWWWGHDWFNIGLGNGMVMARNGDKGYYRLGNIYKATARQNSSDASQHGRISSWVNPVLVDWKNGRREKFMSIKLACEAIRLNRNDFAKLKNGLLNHPLVDKVAVMPKELI